MTTGDHGVGLSARERAELTVRARQRLHRYAWLLAGFAVLGAAVMLGFVLKLAADLPPGRDPTRLWVGGSLVTAFMLATFTGMAWAMRRRARNPELLAGADRSTQAAIRRALRDGHSTDARIDALTRETAQHQLYLLRGWRRFLPWVFCVSALLYLVSLTATWIGDGPRWTMLPAAFGLVGLVWFGAHSPSTCRAAAATSPPQPYQPQTAPMAHTPTSPDDVTAPAADTALFRSSPTWVFLVAILTIVPVTTAVPGQPAGDYGPLDAIARNKVNLDRIVTHWPDMLRVAGSLITNQVRAYDLLRMLTHDGHPTPLGQALAEYGRIAKTLHLLAMVDPVDETYRRTVTRQLNIGESRHSLARKILHGHRGDIMQPYRAGQEDQLGALGLVLNAVMLFNTRYIDLAVTALRAQGYPVRDEDAARLSPLGYAHINMLGRYTFPAPSSAQQLKPLRDPDTVVS